MGIWLQAMANRSWSNNFDKNRLWKNTLNYGGSIYKSMTTNVMTELKYFNVHGILWKKLVSILHKLTKQYRKALQNVHILIKMGLKRQPTITKYSRLIMIWGINQGSSYSLELLSIILLIEVISMLLMFSKWYVKALTQNLKDVIYQLNQFHPQAS